MKSDLEITDEIRHEVRRFRPGLYSWLAVMISAITFPALGLVVSIHLSDQALQRSQQRLCPVVVNADNAAKVNPPVTEFGKQQAKVMAKLRIDYRCDHP